MLKNHRGMAIAIVSVVAGWTAFAPVASANFTTRQQPADPAIPPAADPNRPALQATVLEVVGSVMQAAIGADQKTDVGWTPVKLNDVLTSGSQIKTGFRSHATLKFGDDTVIQVRKNSILSIDEASKGTNENTVRMTLGYGTIRGGSIEGEVRTDVVVDSTVATLAKRGTEGWQMSVEPSTADFKISLSRSGLLEALSRLSGTTKTIRPGEYANRDNIMKLWINQAVFDRAFQFYSDESQSEAESEFGSLNNTGNGVLSPGSGTDATTASNANNPEFVNSVLGDQVTENLPIGPPNRVDRSEGDFGVPDTFQGLLDLTPKRSPRSSHRIGARGR